MPGPYKKGYAQALKRAADTDIDYLLAANSEVVKNLNPAQKRILMENLDLYNKSQKLNAPEYQRILEHYRKSFPAAIAQQYAKQYIAANPLPHDTTTPLNIIKGLLYQPAPQPLFDLKSAIYNQLYTATGPSDPSTPLRHFLRNLPEDKKTSLIAAIITGDGEKIGRILLEAPPACLAHIDKTTLFEVLNRVAQREPFEFHEQHPLGSFQRTLISAIMDSRDGQPPQPPAQKVLFWEGVMKKIPDLYITPKLKTDIASSYFDSWFDPRPELIDPFYFESADNTPSLVTQGNISSQQYLSAIRAPNMDNSEFIMLSLGLLTSQCPDAPELASIRRAYIDRDYESAIAQILVVCNNNKATLGDPLVGAIAEKSKDLIEIDPAKNYNRRYVENAIAREHLLHHVNLERINRVSSRISGVSFDISDPRRAVDIVRDAVSSVNDFYKYDVNAIRARQYEIGEASGIWNLRQKRKKEGFVRKAEEAHSGGGNIAYSRNIGMMVANQPAPRDEIAEHDHINRTPDKSAGFAVYSPKAKRSSMAGDISGHTMWLVARLEAYMIENRSDPNLSADVNEFVKGFAATYIMRGSHSLDEVYDMLRTPAVQKIFTDNGVTLDLSWSEPLLKRAMDAGQDYAKNLAMQRAMQAELLAGAAPLKASPPPRAKAEPTWTEAEKEMLVGIQREDQERLGIIRNLNELKKYANLHALSENSFAKTLSAILPKNFIHQDTDMDVLIHIQAKVHNFLCENAQEKTFADFMLNDPIFSAMLTPQNRAGINEVILRTKFLQDEKFDGLVSLVGDAADFDEANAAVLKGLQVELGNQKGAFLRGALSAADLKKAMENATQAVKKSFGITDSMPPAVDPKIQFLHDEKFDPTIALLEQAANFSSPDASNLRALQAELHIKKEAFLKGELSQPDMKSSIEKGVKLAGQAFGIIPPDPAPIPTPLPIDPKIQFLQNAEFDSILELSKQAADINPTDVELNAFCIELPLQKQLFLRGEIAEGDMRKLLDRGVELAKGALSGPAPSVPVTEPVPVAAAPTPAPIDPKIQFLHSAQFDSILDLSKQAADINPTDVELNAFCIELPLQKQLFLRGEVTEGDMQKLLDRGVELAKRALSGPAIPSVPVNEPAPVAAAPTAEHESRKKYLKELHFDAILRKIHSEFTLNHPNSSVFHSLYTELLHQKEAFLKGEMSKPDFDMAVRRAAELSIKEISKAQVLIALNEKGFDSIIEKIRSGLAQMDPNQFKRTVAAFEKLNTQLMQHKQRYLDGEINESQFQKLCGSAIKSCTSQAHMELKAKGVSDELLKYAQDKLGIGEHSAQYNTSMEQVTKMKSALTAMKDAHPTPVLTKPPRIDPTTSAPAVGA